MTIPFNVPPVQPIWFQPGKSDAETVAEGIHSLGAGLAQMLQQRQAQQEQNQMGEMLKSMLMGMDQQQVTTPAQSIPGAGSVPGFQMPEVQASVPGPLANAVRGKPGSVVYGALGKAQPMLQEQMAARLEDQKSRNDMALERLRQSGTVEKSPPASVIWEGTGDTELGWVRKGDSPNLMPLLKPNGDQASRPRTGASPSGGSWVKTVNKRDGRAGLVNPTTKEFFYLGSDLGFEGVVNNAERQSGAMYTSTASAWNDAKALIPKLTLDFAQTVIMLRAMNGSAKALETATTNGLMTPENQQFMVPFLEVLQNIVYNTTGKQINDNEFARRVREILPVKGDSDATIQSKTRRIESGIKAMYITGRRALRDAGDFGIDVPTLEETIGHEAPPQDDEPGNPYAP